MTPATAWANLAMGAAYMVIGTLVVIDMARHWRTRDPSLVGLALIGLAFTCGPHHVDHGLHLFSASDGAAGVDLLTVLVGLPPGAAFAALRVEGFLGGAGDRRLEGTPAWLAATPGLLVINVAIAYTIMSTSGAGLDLSPAVVPSIALVIVYAAIAVALGRAQLDARSHDTRWSLSGLSLAGIFATCAPMHAVVAFYTATGRYAADVHGVAVDLTSIPAGVFFLWVVRRLGRSAPATPRVASPSGLR